ncbi:MAG: hypothetical protein ACYDDF_02370 [Thermoplasmatota archaeon]
MRRVSTPGLVSLGIALLFAGCLTAPSSSTVPQSLASTPSTIAGALSFLPPVSVDPTRIGSEPSIIVAKDGSIFVSAPTGNIKYATRPQDFLVEDTRGAGQSAIWRSRDGGETFQFLSMAPLPYHSPEPGGGDSAMAFDSAGTLYLADQIGLVSEAIQSSKDLGDTWSVGTPLASGTVDTDRQWLAADPGHPGVVYMVYDHTGVGINVAKTTDGGQTWMATQATQESTSPGTIVASKDLVAFSFFSGNDIMFAHSSDAGATWKEEPIGKGHGPISTFFPQTFFDRNGTLYVTWMEKAGIAYSYSRDLGKTWSPNVLAVPLNSTHTFLWAVGGDAGRLGFSWYDAKDPNATWYEMAAIVVNADSAHPSVSLSQVSPTAVRVGAPCESGSTCTSGREFGDFQSCAIAPNGDLVVAYVHVLNAQDGGIVMFGRVATGPRLIDSPFNPWVV